MSQHYYLNNLKDHYPVVAEKQWKSNLCNSLLSLHNYTDLYSDVFIVVGNERIYTHRLILGVNSQVLEEAEVWLGEEDEGRDKTRFFHVKLLQEFDEFPQVLREIVGSFYSGDIQISYENIKIVYKFAQCYGVQWLLKYAELMFDEIIGLENFVDLFVFAQKCGQENNKLVESCLNHLDYTFLSQLFETGHVYDLDYYCLKSITSSKFSTLSGVEMFNLVTRWAEFDRDRRKCHIEILLFDIKYHRIAKTDLLDLIYPWVASVEGVEDSVKVSLMQTIQKRIAEADIRENFLTNGLKLQGISDMRVDQFMGKMIQAAEDKGARRSILAAVLSSDEVLAVVKCRFQTAEPYIKQCILEYISDNKIFSTENVTSFIRLYDLNRNEELKWLLQKFLSISRLRITFIDWTVLTSNLVSEFLKDIEVDELEFLKLECIMRWGEANVDRTVELEELLLTLVCYHKVPQQYQTHVLRPHLTQLLPDNQIDLTCGIHPEDAMIHHEERFLNCVTKSLTRNFYMVQNTAMEFNFKDCGKRWLNLRLNGTPPLQLVSRLRPNDVTDSDYEDGYSIGNYTDFLLYDKKKCMKRYPLHSKCTLNLNQLREMFGTYKHLYIMVLTDGAGVNRGEALTRPVPPIPPRATIPTGPEIEPVYLHNIL